MDSLNPSPQQWSYLLDNIKDDKEMLFGIFLRPNGKARTNVKWAELASQRNAQGGAIKTTDKWREAWVGLRGRARAASRAKVQYVAGTGGGPPPEVVGLGLNPTYERVLLLVGTSGAEPNNVPDPLMAQLNATTKRVPAAHASGVAVGAAAPDLVATPVRAVQAQALPQGQRVPAAHASGVAVGAAAPDLVATPVRAVQAQAPPQGQRVTAAHASGVAVGAAAHGPVATPVPAVQAQALPQRPFMLVEVKPDLDNSPMMSLSDICDEATALNIKYEDTISLSDTDADILTMSPLVIKSENTTVSPSDASDVITFSDVSCLSVMTCSDNETDLLAMSPLVIKSENTKVSLSDASDVITLSDTPIKPKKNLHTPPRGSGFTPGAKKKLYDEEQPLYGGSQESTLERQLRLTQRALEESANAIKLLSEALSKVSWK